MKAVVAGAVLLALLTGCASVARAPRDPQAFDLLGRILVTSRDTALTANLRWEHVLPEDRIWLMTPTGQTVAYITDSEAGASLTRADQKQYRADSVEALTRQALGWPLPLSLLQYWVRGQVAPGFEATDVERTPEGQLLGVTQQGWHVTITYYSEGEMSGQVRRLDLQGGDNQIRLVVDTWRSTS
jgi:outer membrane lipoprotein LolB